MGAGMEWCYVTQPRNLCLVALELSDFRGHIGPCHLGPCHLPQNTICFPNLHVRISPTLLAMQADARTGTCLANTIGNAAVLGHIINWPICFPTSLYKFLRSAC